jgi:hypothetical protein
MKTGSAVLLSTMRNVIENVSKVKIDKKRHMGVTMRVDLFNLENTDPIEGDRTALQFSRVKT